MGLGQPKKTSCWASTRCVPSLRHVGKITGPETSGRRRLNGNYIWPDLLRLEAAVVLSRMAGVRCSFTLNRPIAGRQLLLHSALPLSHNCNNWAWHGANHRLCQWLKTYGCIRSWQRSNRSRLAVSVGAKISELSPAECIC